MRKKILLAQLHNYIEKNGALSAENEQLKSEIESVRSEMQELKIESESLKERLEEAEKRAEELSAAANETVTDEPTLSGRNESVAAADAEGAAPAESSSRSEDTVSADGSAAQGTTKSDIYTSGQQGIIFSETGGLDTEDGTIDVTALGKIPVNKETAYAAEAIGDIVVLCASVCSDLAKEGGARSRELINLALGRTEVFKADCLTIAGSDTGYSVKKECIDRIRRDAEEYIKGLLTEGRA